MIYTDKVNRAILAAISEIPREDSDKHLDVRELEWQLAIARGLLANITNRQREEGYKE